MQEETATSPGSPGLLHLPPSFSGTFSNLEGLPFSLCEVRVAMLPPSRGKEEAV